ncbi:MAG: DUF4255 domain-containing protein [Draconibacterium sp.]
MIDVALTYIRDLLNEHLRNEFSISENKVVLSNIVKPDGSEAQNVAGKIVFFLVGLEEESTLKNSINRNQHSGGGTFAFRSSSLPVNLRLLFCANFDSNIYIEGLSYLSALIRFFHINKRIPLDVKDTNSPRYISFELNSLGYDELSHLWSAIGSKLMPSVLYKAGIVMHDDIPVQKLIPAVGQTETTS